MTFRRTLAATLAATHGAAIAVLLSFASGHAVAQQWTPLGAFGGRITALATSAGAPLVVLTGAQSGGLYRSLDAGASWVPTGASQLGTQTVHAAAFDPSGTGVAWAGTESRGIFRSGDGGATWAPASTGLPPQGTSYPPVFAIAADPADPSLVLAGLGLGGAAGKLRIYRSIDGGRTWNETAGSGLEGTAITDLEFGAGAVFAATEGKGVWVSEDRGQFWEHVGDGTIDNTSVEALAVDETTAPPRLLIALSTAVYSATPPASPAPVAARRASKWAVATFLYFASYGFKYNREILIALEKGEFPPKPKPTPAPPAPGFATAAAAAADVIPAFFTGTLTNGVQRSLDGGVTWAGYNTGLTPVEVDRLASSPGWLFAGTDGAGVWRRADGASAWTRASAGLRAPSVPAVAVDPSAPATLYAGSEGSGVLKSVDGGVTFGAVGFASMIHNAFDPWVAALVVDPNATSNVYAVTGQGFFRSTNGGASWTRVPLPGNTYPRTLAAGPGTPTALWLGGSPGVLHSADGGLTWTRPDPAFNQGVTSIAISRTTPQTMYAGTMSNGVWKTTNGGTSWAHVNNDGGSGFLTFGAVPALAVDPTTAETVYACVDRHAIYKTTNGGASWENLKEGLFDAGAFAYAMLTAIVVNPADPKTLFAGSAGTSNAGATFYGVYRSNDGGAHWAKFGSGLESVPVKSLIFDPTNKNRLYAGTEGGGVFRYGPAVTRTHEVRERLSRP